VRRSIRWRLTVWNAVGVAVVLVGFAALVYWLAGRAFRQQADRTAEAAFRLVETDPRMATNAPERAKYWVREFDEHMGVLAAIYGPDGSPLAAHPGVASRGLSGEVAVRRLETDPDGHRWRLAVDAVRAGDQDVHILLLVPLRNQEADLAALGRAMLLAIPVGLVATAGLAYLLARGAVAPVDQLRRTTEQITADRLHERLPVHNPDDELGQLASTVNTMIGRLERSFAEIKRFTADASHELRTPLTAIRTEAEVALAGDPTKEELRGIIESMLEESGRMARLTDQLLTLARDDAGVVPRPLERLSITSLASEVVDTLRPLADARRVDIAFEESETLGTVVGDSVRLRQVVVNLIDNAIKYTPPGGSVRVGTAEVDGEVRLTVADTGEGIPAEHLPRVFDRFYRVDKARSRELGGTGLGLSIARSIVTAHGGAIALTSVEGVGTTATVTITLGRTAGHA
jgi:two-component system, OmpR family, heavy metal sensor histidine kinase CusS